MKSVREVRAVAGKGLERDRYFRETGKYSKRRGPHRQVTLIEMEALEAVRHDTRNQSQTESVPQKRRHARGPAQPPCGPGVPCGKGEAARGSPVRALRLPGKADRHSGRPKSPGAPGWPVRRDPFRRPDSCGGRGQGGLNDWKIHSKQKGHGTHRNPLMFLVRAESLLPPLRRPA